MNWIELILDRLLWASVSGLVLVAAVLAICRWAPIASGAKVWICRLAWLKLLFGLAVGSPLVFYSSTSLAKGEIVGGAIDPRHFAAFLFAIYVVGVLIELGLLGRAAWIVRQLVRLDRPAEAESAAIVGRVGARFGLKRVDVRVLDGLQEPCVVSAIRPRLLLPPTLRPANDELALAHELAHLKHFDLFWTAVASLAQALFWFLPGMNALFREMALWQEARADEFAHRSIGASPSEMARRVLAAAQMRPAFGLSFGAAETERRIRAILESKPNRFALVLVIPLVLAAAAPVRVEPAPVRGRIYEGRGEIADAVSPAAPIRIASPVVR